MTSIRLKAWLFDHPVYRSSAEKAEDDDQDSFFFFFSAWISIRYSSRSARCIEISSSLIYLQFLAPSSSSIAHIYFAFSDTPRDLWRLFYFTDCRIRCCLSLPCYVTLSRISREIRHNYLAQTMRNRALMIYSARLLSALFATDNKAMIKYIAILEMPNTKEITVL